MDSDHTDELNEPTDTNKIDNEDGTVPQIDVPNHVDIPEDLAERDQWLMWDASTKKPRAPRDEKGDKASWTDPDEWMSFERAREIAKGIDARGIGYVFANTNDDYPRGLYGGLDLDGCVDDDGRPKEWLPSLQPFFDRDAYMEYSPSTHDDSDKDGGIKIPLAGFESPEWWSNVNFNERNHEGVDAYGNHFFTVTGDRLQGAGETVADTGDWVEDLLAEAYEVITGEGPRERQHGATGEGAPDSTPGGAAAHHRPQTDADEWFDEEHAHAVLVHGDYIDPDLPYDEWVRIGFALADHFPDRAAEQLFEEWSRGGTKWDAQAERDVPGIIADANGDVGIGTLIYHAKQGGWNASAAAKAARATDEGHDPECPPAEAPAAVDGGTAVQTVPEPDATTGGPGPEAGGATSSDDGTGDAPDWGHIQRLFQSYEKGSTGVAKQGAAKRLLAEFDVLTVENNNVIWRYDPEIGIFVDDGQERLRQRLATGLDWAYSQSRVNDILHRVRSETYVESDVLGVDDPDLLCVENGVLDLSELQEKVEEEGLALIEAVRDLDLHEHSPEYRFISRLHVRYDPEAYGDEHDGWERWTRYIGERVEPRDITNVQEYAGYCLHGEYSFKKAFLALGPHNSGKTTFLSAIHRLFPDEAVATEPVQDLTNNRFSAANLHGARINIAGDLGTRELNDLERFKTVTGDEERMRAEIKGKQAYSFKPRTKFLWAANNVPEVDDPDDEAFINRWVFAEFPNQVEEPDDRVKQRLLRDETLQALLLWALGGYATLFGWDGSNRGLSQERSIEAKRAMWNKHGDTIDQFIVQCLNLTGDTEDKVAVADVYKAYQEFCYHREKPAETKDTFSKSVLAQALITDGQRRVDSPFSSTDRPRCYIGARYSDLGEQFWAVAAGKISRDALDEEIDPDEWVDDRDDRGDRDGRDEQSTDDEQGDDSTADTDGDGDGAASNGGETANNGAGDGGPRGREDQLIEVIRALGGDTDPVARGVIFGRASALMDIKQAEYAFDDLRDRGAIYAPPDTDGDAWILAR